MESCVLAYDVDCRGSDATVTLFVLFVLMGLGRLSSFDSDKN